MRGARLALALAALVSLTGCAALPPACLPPARLMASAEMLFGRNIGGRLGVSEADFAAFTAREITPRFPDGLTVIDARGQWRERARARLLREPSKLVLIAFVDAADRRAAITAIAEAYKRAFRQQAVMIAIRSACVSF